jgi:hypothetical protein
LSAGFDQPAWITDSELKQDAGLRLRQYEKFCNKGTALAKPKTEAGCRIEIEAVRKVL